MSKTIVKPLRARRTISTCLLLAMLAFGCAAIPASSGPAGPRLEPAALPSYSQGTTFVYSDGNWETVIDTAPGMVTWKDHRNYIFSGSPDFTYRPSKWEGKTRSVTRQFGPRTDLYARSATRVWPLRAGNFANYSETGTWVEKDGTQSSYRTDWSCAVTGTERVSVMAGDFDTFKIVCRRYYVSSNKNQSRLREEKTWNYAPEVGHYVLATTRYYYDKKPRRQELLAVLLPLNGLSAEARRQIERSFQQALEGKKSGQSVSWSSAKLRASVETMPTQTFKTVEGSYSRRYVQKLTLPDGQRTYYGLAVRNANGVWTIPRR
jgi:surface antigen